MSARTKWLIFDGDNTLWHIEHLYDKAREEMCSFLATYGVDSKVAENYQMNRDKELHATYGYSACRFARSFEDTALRFAPDIESKAIKAVRLIAMSVFEAPASMADDLEALLTEVKGEYMLGLITAGERWVQQKRLADFSLASEFDKIKIVESKSKEIFDDFIADNDVDRDQSWVIGDSINSDAIPALEAGLRAILVTAKNWSVVEGSANDLPSAAISVNRLSQISLQLLAGRV